MKIKWGDEKIKGLAKPVKTAVPDNSWIFWLIIAACSLAGLLYLIMEVIA